MNIELLVEDGQLKDVVKDGKVTPEVEIIYNVKLSRKDDVALTGECDSF